VLLASCDKNESKTNLHITGNIKGLKKELYTSKELSYEPCGQTILNIDGSSVFESDIELQSPEMLYLFLDRGNE
jgi:hypothetical protein